MADTDQTVTWPRPDRVGKRWQPLPDAIGEPDARGPVRYLWWLIRRQRARVLYGAVVSSVWMSALMLPPYLIARGVDDGLRADDFGALGWWAAALLGVGLVNGCLGTLRHRTMTYARMYAGFHTVELLTRHTLRLGATFARQSSTGDLVTVSGSDIQRIGQVLTLTGPGVGAVVGYGVVTVLLLTISAPLAAMVLLGVPLVALSVGPLLGRLQRVESEYREQQGELTGRSVDLAAGLRVLAGIGGRELFGARYRDASRRLRAEGYRVGAVNSWIEALITSLPSVFLAAVTWVAARMAVSGDITVGELVAVYGYMALLIVPVFFLIEGTDQFVRALVSARRVMWILRAEPAPDTGAARSPAGADGPELHDPASGLVVPSGTFFGLVPRRPADGIRALDRLGRYGDEHAGGGEHADGGGRFGEGGRPGGAGQPGRDTRVTWGGVPLAELPLADVRAQLLVAENEAHLFAGTLREAVSPGDALRGQVEEDAVREALRVAVAEDVMEALPDGLDSRVEPQARNLSGGQRQRLRLARAVLADPEVLLLVEPTSAVDAHTEALVATRLRAARQGRTTVVVTTSPLLLDQTDQVGWLDADGRLAAQGTHPELLTRRPDYRALVFRGDPDGREGGHEDGREGGDGEGELAGLEPGSGSGPQPGGRAAHPSTGTRTRGSEGERR